MMNNIKHNNAKGSSEDFFMKSSDGNIFGPVTLIQLKKWSIQGRINPDNAISQDKKSWKPITELEDLKMIWSVELINGSTYGPVHLRSLQVLMEDGSIPPKATLTNIITGDSLNIEDKKDEIFDTSTNDEVESDSSPAKEEKPEKPAEKKQSEKAEAKTTRLSVGLSGGAKNNALSIRIKKLEEKHRSTAEVLKHAKEESAAERQRYSDAEKQSQELTDDLGRQIEELRKQKLDMAESLKMVEIKLQSQPKIEDSIDWLEADSTNQTEPKPDKKEENVPEAVESETTEAEASEPEPTSEEEAIPEVEAKKQNEGTETIEGEAQQLKQEAESLKVEARKHQEEAETQRKEAEIQRKEAEIQRTELKDLIERLSNNTSEKTEQILTLQAELKKEKQVSIELKKESSVKQNELNNQIKLLEDESKTTSKQIDVMKSDFNKEKLASDDIRVQSETMSKGFEKQISEIQKSTEFYQTKLVQTKEDMEQQKYAIDELTQRSYRSNRELATRLDNVQRGYKDITEQLHTNHAQMEEMAQLNDVALTSLIKQKEAEFRAELATYDQSIKSLRLRKSNLQKLSSELGELISRADRNFEDLESVSEAEELLNEAEKACQNSEDGDSEEKHE